jgi:hypothetical protein
MVSRLDIFVVKKSKTTLTIPKMAHHLGPHWLRLDAPPILFILSLGRF